MVSWDLVSYIRRVQVVEIWNKVRFDEAEQIPLTLNGEQGEVGK